MAKRIKLGKGDYLLSVPEGCTINIEPGGRITGLASPVVTDSNGNHDITASENGSYINMTATGAKTVTARPNATHALPDNGEWHVRNGAASGDVTLTAGLGVTLDAPAGGTLVMEPGMTVTLKRVAVNQFHVIGQTVAA